MQTNIQEQIKQIEQDLSAQIKQVSIQIESDTKRLNNLRDVLKLISEVSILLNNDALCSDESNQNTDQPEVTQTKEGSGLKKHEVVVDPFNYEPEKVTTFERIEIFEDDINDRVAIKYNHKYKYFVSISKVREIPFPIPVNFFRTIKGWNSSAEQAVRYYRKYLYIQSIGTNQDIKKLLDEDTEKDPDRGFKRMLNTDTRTHGEDYEKVGSVE